MVSGEERRGETKGATTDGEQRGEERGGRVRRGDCGSGDSKSVPLAKKTLFFHFLFNFPLFFAQNRNTKKINKKSI